MQRNHHQWTQTTSGTPTWVIIKHPAFQRLKTNAMSHKICSIPEEVPVTRTASPWWGIFTANRFRAIQKAKDPPKNIKFSLVRQDDECKVELERIHVWQQRPQSIKITDRDEQHEEEPP